MAESYVGEIRMFAGNFAPEGWAFCNGQLLSISEYETLYTLIGTTYGGDGQNTFALPDLQGRVPVHAGQGPGISRIYVLGEQVGTETVTLTTSQMPAHTHLLTASAAPATSVSPQGQVVAASGGAQLYLDDVPATAMQAGSVGVTGGGYPHENMPPYLATSFIISLFGVFPTQV